MTDFLLNECGDLDYTDGKLTVVTGVDAIRQRWLIYIRTYLGEWFLDQSIGVPYFQRVLKKAVSRTVLKQVFKDATLEVPGVLQVVSVIVDSLDVATRFAEVTVTCIVTGDEGPETGTFRFTGTIPEDECGTIVAAPLQIQTAAQWYWFDPNDLKFVSGADLAGTPGLPYVPGDELQLDNKFEKQQGTCMCLGILAPNPQILPVLNGRKGVDLETSSNAGAIAGLGINPNEIRALRPSTGHNIDGRFTVFGVYRPDSAPVAYSPLMALDGLDADGITRRWINVRFRDNSGLQLQFHQDTVVGPGATIDSSVAASVAVDEPWAFAMSYQIVATNVHIKFWINGVLVLDGDPGPKDLLEQTGAALWNGGFSQTGDADALQRTNIGDLIGYAEVLTDAETAGIFAYLTTKWGL